MVTPQQRGLVTKLAKILGSVGKVQKKGFNSHFQYKFVREADLVEAVRDKLAENSIFITASVKRTEVVEMSKVIGKTGEVVQYKVGFLYVEYTFRDGETGEVFTVEGIGEIDQDGGKGIYKAITGAMKYMLMKNFLIDTGDDPEMDGVGKAAPAPQRAQGAPRKEAGDQGAGKGYPATTAQKNCITKHWHELAPHEQQKMQDWMTSKGIKSDAMTKRQASDVIDEMMVVKKGRGAGAVPRGAPSPVSVPAPSASQIEQWANDMTAQTSVFELNQIWISAKAKPMQAQQLKYLQEVRADCLKKLNSMAI